VCLVYGLVPLSRVLKDLVEPGQGLGSGFGLGFNSKISWGMLWVRGAVSRMRFRHSAMPMKFDSFRNRGLGYGYGCCFHLTSPRC